jgi:O-antigen/teichoic acid export membrane protein
MFRKILGTVGTRILTAAIAFLVVVLNARVLGAANLGTISLIIFSVTIIQLLNNFLAGSALIYLTPRVGLFRPLMLGYAWTLIITIACYLLFLLIGVLFRNIELIPASFVAEFFLLAMALSMTTVNMMGLLGMEQVKTYNLMNLMQMVIQIGVIASLFFIFRIRSVHVYLWASITSYSITFLFSLIMLAPFMKPFRFDGIPKIMRDLFRFGAFVQFANIFQQMNYRLSYYFVDFFAGRAALGLLSVGVQISESLWLISRSIATVQYSRISNEMDDGYSARITLALAKVTWVFTLLALLLLILLPSFLFDLVFGAGFGAIKPVIAALSVGIITLSVSMVFSTFFSGINKPWHNTISSAIGLVFTVSLGLLLIPTMGIVGAAITATCSYTAATVYQFIIFSRLTRLTIRDFLLKKSDLLLVNQEFRKIIGKAGKPDSGIMLP